MSHKTQKWIITAQVLATPQSGLRVYVCTNHCVPACIYNPPALCVKCVWPKKNLPVAAGGCGRSQPAHGDSGPSPLQHSPPAHALVVLLVRSVVRKHRTPLGHISTRGHTVVAHTSSLINIQRLLRVTEQERRPMMDAIDSEPPQRAQWRFIIWGNWRGS